jgi:hypothetical protein
MSLVCSSVLSLTFSIPFCRKPWKQIIRNVPELRVHTHATSYPQLQYAVFPLPLYQSMIQFWIGIIWDCCAQENWHHWHLLTPYIRLIKSELYKIMITNSIGRYRSRFLSASYYSVCIKWSGIKHFFTISNLLSELPQLWTLQNWANFWKLKYF